MGWPATAATGTSSRRCQKGSGTRWPRRGTSRRSKPRSWSWRRRSRGGATSPAGRGTLNRIVGPSMAENVHVTTKLNSPGGTAPVAGVSGARPAARTRLAASTPRVSREGNMPPPRLVAVGRAYPGRVGPVPETRRHGRASRLRLPGARAPRTAEVSRVLVDRPRGDASRHPADRGRQPLTNRSNRPAQPMTVLRDAGPRVLGGRDQLAGGTWLAVNDAGVVAGLTNRPTKGQRDPAKRSRGELPLRLRATTRPRRPSRPSVRPSAPRITTPRVAPRRRPRDALRHRHDR